MRLLLISCLFYRFVQTHKCCDFCDNVHARTMTSKTLLLLLSPHTHTHTHTHAHMHTPYTYYTLAASVSVGKDDRGRFRYDRDMLLSYRGYSQPPKDLDLSVLGRINQLKGDL